MQKPRVQFVNPTGKCRPLGGSGLTTEKAAAFIPGVIAEMQPLNPDTGFLHACAWHQRTQGMQPCGNDWPGGWDCPMKISGHFIPFFPLKKPLFSPVWLGSPPSRGLLLSILAPNRAALTLTLCFHSNMLQYSVSGLVMLDAFTYGKDCMIR